MLNKFSAALAGVALFANSCSISLHTKQDTKINSAKSTSYHRFIREEMPKAMGPYRESNYFLPGGDQFVIDKQRFPLPNDQVGYRAFSIRDSLIFRMIVPKRNAFSFIKNDDSKFDPYQWSGVKFEVVGDYKQKESEPYRGAFDRASRFMHSQTYKKPSYFNPKEYSKGTAEWQANQSCGIFQEVIAPYKGYHISYDFSENSVTVYTNSPGVSKVVLGDFTTVNEALKKKIPKARQMHDAFLHEERMLIQGKSDSLTMVSPKKGRNGISTSF